MKFSTALVLSLTTSTATAFAPAARPSLKTRFASTTVAVEAAPVEPVTPATPPATAVVDGAVVQEAAAIDQGMQVEMPLETTTTTSSSSSGRIQPGRYNDKPDSIALPFMKRPPALDGSHAGDYGFDPLGFTETQDLYIMQEAELRHARLAMLAVVGWPLSELVAPEWMLQQNGCAPSVLNGFNLLSFAGVVAAFGAIGFFEFQTSLRRVDNTKLGAIHEEDMADVWKWGVAGDYNFDPLNLYASVGDDAFARKGLREVEISHGRSAMLGITAFAMWEFLTGHPIVENSMFFHPNLLLPALGAGYLAFNYYYEIERTDEKFSIQLSSEGEARMENLKMVLPQSGTGGDSEDMTETLGKVSDAVEKVKEFTANLNLSEKTEKAQQWYIDNVVEPKK